MTSKQEIADMQEQLSLQSMLHFSDWCRQQIFGSPFRIPPVALRLTRTQETDTVEPKHPKQ